MDIHKTCREPLILPKEALTPYFHTSRIGWTLLTSPAISLVVLFLLIAEQFALFSGNKGLGNRIYVLRGYQGRDLAHLWDTAIQREWAAVPSYNGHNPEHKELYTHPGLSPDEVPYPLYPEIKKVDFLQREGLCRGSVLYFAHLVNRFKNQGIPLPEATERAASLFWDGVPKPAALLQAMGGAEKPLLAIVVEKVRECTKEGVYLFAKEGHAVAYIKEKGYTAIWDPSRGLFPGKRFEKGDGILFSLRRKGEGVLE